MCKAQPHPSQGGPANFVELPLDLLSVVTILVWVTCTSNLVRRSRVVYGDAPKGQEIKKIKDGLDAFADRMTPLYQEQFLIRNPFGRGGVELSAWFVEFIERDHRGVSL